MKLPDQSLRICLVPVLSDFLALCFIDTEAFSCNANLIWVTVLFDFLTFWFIYIHA